MPASDWPVGRFTAQLLVLRPGRPAWSDYRRARRAWVTPYGEPMTRTLYHFTKPELWEQILATGALEPRWPKDRAAPQTVHVMQSRDPKDLPWAYREGRTVRFELRIPEAEAHHWFGWAKDNVPSNAHRSLGVPVWTPDDHFYVNEQNLGSKHWYVIERAVPAAEWVAVMNIDTDKLLWRAPAQ